MKRLAALSSLMLLAVSAPASELTFDFKSPAFSGVGYSSHVLTIAQLEENRKRQNRDDARAEEERVEREKRNSNVYKFQNNLESRIYAQLSRQIAEQLFGESFAGEDAEGIVETPFGDVIQWKRNDDVITITIFDSNGDVLAEFSVPIGSFAF